MKRRGQIFLIMTILVVSFMIGITTVLLDIQKSDFLEPAPDSEIALDAWDLTITSIYEILDIQLAIDNTGGVKNIDAPLNDLSSYLTQRAIANSISVGAVTVANSAPTADVNILSISGSFSIFLSSSSTTIQQNLDIQITYVMDIDASDIVISKNINGEVQYLDGTNFDNVVTDLGNGAYSHAIASTTTVTATLYNTITLVANVP